MTDRLIDGLRQFDPCRDAVKWIGNMTLEEVWSKCQRIDWMMWLLDRLIWQHGNLVDVDGWPDHEDCLRLAVKLLTPTIKNPEKSKIDRELMEKIFKVCLDFADRKISGKDAQNSINKFARKVDDGFLSDIANEMRLLDIEDGTWSVFHSIYQNRGYSEIYRKKFLRVSKGLCDFLRLHVPCGPKWW